MFRCSLRAVFGPPGQGRVCPGCRRWWPSRGLRPALNVSLFMSPLPSLRSFPPSATLTLTLSHQNILRSWTARQRTRCTFAPSSFEGPAGSTDHEAVSVKQGPSKTSSTSSTSNPQDCYICSTHLALRKLRTANSLRLYADLFREHGALAAEGLPMLTGSVSLTLTHLK